MIAIDSGQISSFNNYSLRFNIDDLLVYIFKKFKQSAVKKFDILHAIYRYKIPKTIICAIESGANITITYSFNEGALHLAAKHKLKEVAEHLISHGLDINAKGKHGKTPLHYAAGKSLDMVEFLISHGADINATTRQKETVLSFAQFYHKNDIVKILISHGAKEK